MPRTQRPASPNLTEIISILNKGSEIVDNNVKPFSPCLVDERQWHKKLAHPNSTLSSFLSGNSFF
jgi:hypothetical protein